MERFLGSRAAKLLFPGIWLAMALAAPQIALGLDFNLDGVPALGPAEAPVQVIVFYDFQCRHCAEACPVLLSVLKEYGNLVRLAAVNVPGPGHALAKPAAELAMIAGEHGKFWEAFEMLLANQSRFSEAYFREAAAALGLDAKEVDEKMKAGAHHALIKRNFLDAIDLGVEATPTIYINERRFVGLKDANAYRYYINEELAARGIQSPVGPVAKPEEKTAEARRDVPAKLIFPVGTLPPRDSTLKVAVGQSAPLFTLPTTDLGGAKFRLAEYRGKKNVVLSFVPAAWTPVCSAQWPEYNEHQEIFEKTDTVLVGITVDNIPSLYAWTATMGELWFPVASDFYPHGAVATRYGVLRSNGVAERALFVIDKRGVIRYIDVHDINTSPDFQVLKEELEKLGK